MNVPELAGVLGDGFAGAAIVGAAALIIAWYRRQATDAEAFHTGRLDQLRTDFEKYRTRTDAELVDHRRQLDECRSREVALQITEAGLRSEVASLRRRLNDLEPKESP